MRITFPIRLPFLFTSRRNFLFTSPESLFRIYRNARFTSPGIRTIPQNWNKYAYVGGDPANKTDPSGLCSPEYDPPCYSATAYAIDFGKYTWGPPSLGSYGGPPIPSIYDQLEFTPEGGWGPLPVRRDGTPVDEGRATSNSEQNVSKSPATCGTSGSNGFGVGLLAGSSVGLGAGPNYSIGGTASVGVGGFVHGGRVTPGAFASAGGFASSTGQYGNYPLNRTRVPNGTVGSFAGIGGGLFIANVGHPSALRGSFTTIIFALPPILGIPGLGAELDFAGDIFVASVTWGKSTGLPAGAMILQTNTFFTTGSPCP